MIQKRCSFSNTSRYWVTFAWINVFPWLCDVIVHLDTREKRRSFYIAGPAIRRVVRLRCISSSWNVVFTRRSVFFALCIHIVRIRINYILVSASSDILFDPLKAKRKLLLARKIWFFTCIGVIFWQVIAKHEAILRLTSSLALFTYQPINHSQR